MAISEATMGLIQAAAQARQDSIDADTALTTAMGEVVKAQNAADAADAADKEARKAALDATTTALTALTAELQLPPAPSKP